MDAKTKFFDLMDKLGGVCTRHTGKHYMFQLPNGQTVTVPKTPSSVRTWHNMLADLKRVSGTQAVHKEGERRPKKVRQDPPYAGKRWVIADASQVSQPTQFFEKLMTMQNGDTPQKERKKNG